MLRAVAKWAVRLPGVSAVRATSVSRAMSSVAQERPSNVGILGMECYIPQRFVRQQDLEDADGVGSGKYTIGLGQNAMAFIDDREDINSICLSAVSRLLERYNIDPRDVGRLEVGTESLVDKSKSTKTTLMKLFADAGNRDLEGATVMNACYGGTASFFNSAAWVESSAWDGRYAVFVAADVAVYEAGPARPTGGVGAVACLVGPDAPLALLSRTRTTHASDEWDFYKPRMMSEYPTVDGKHSLACYLRAVDDTYNRTLERFRKGHAEVLPAGATHVDDYFHNMVFHSPYNKLVRQSFARLVWNDFKRCVADGVAIPAELEELLPYADVTHEDAIYDGKLMKLLTTLADARYEAMVEPSTRLSKEIGNTYTASVFANILSLVDAKQSELVDSNVGVFSYGSGAIASMYALRGRNPTSSGFTLDRIAETVGLQDRLAARTPATPTEFGEALQMREQVYGASAYKPVGSTANLAAGTFYVDSVDELHRRSYAQVPPSA